MRIKGAKTMSESNNPTKNTIILPYQQAVYDRLCAVARACLLVDRKSIGSLKLRANFLLLGPTGTGKTFLARAVAEEMKVPFLAISISDWIILGGTTRGSEVTWKKILEFIKDSLYRGRAVIFLDELDKCHHDSNWNAFLRSEVFSLCDARIPLGMNTFDDEDGIIPTTNVEEIAEFLSHRTMIIGGAAFQGVWDTQSTSRIGFNHEQPACSPPEIHDLVRFLPRELINRFCSDIFILPQLTRVDYQVMIQTLADGISETWRKRFIEIGMARLDQAVRHQKGARYAEEVLLAAVVAERSSLSNWVPEIEDSDSINLSPDIGNSIGIF